MAVYRRGKTWWFEFQFDGRKIQESSKCKNKNKAIDMMAIRKAGLIDGRMGLTRAKRPTKFESAVESFKAWSNDHLVQKHTSSICLTATHYSAISAASGQT